MSLRNSTRVLSVNEDAFVKSMKWEKIDAAAAYVAITLRTFGTATVRLEPGDATVYTITVTAPGQEIWSSAEGVIARPGDDYIVTLESGLTYPWPGFAMHYDYCATKWTPNRNQSWTGMLMAEFLTSLAALLVAVPS